MTTDQAEATERMATLVAETEWSMAMKRETYIRADSMLGMSRATHIWILVCILLVLLGLVLALVLIFTTAQPVAAPSAPVPYPNISDFFAHPANLPAPSMKP